MNIYDYVRCFYDIVTGDFTLKTVVLAFWFTFILVSPFYIIKLIKFIKGI